MDLKHYWKKLQEVVSDHPKGRPYVGGQFYPDPTPVAPPVGYVPEISMFDRVREMIRSDALKKVAVESGAESFEEADDFDVDDDYEPFSPYELIVEQAQPDGPTTTPEVNAAIPPTNGDDPPPEAPETPAPEAAAPSK